MNKKPKKWPDAVTFLLSIAEKPKTKPRQEKLEPMGKEETVEEEELSNGQGLA